MNCFIFIFEEELFIVKIPDFDEDGIEASNFSRIKEYDWIFLFSRRCHFLFKCI